MKMYIRLTLLCSIIFGLFFGVGAGITGFIQKNTATDINNENTPVVAQKDGDLTNILVLGVDARPGEKHSRSDTMILVSIDPKLDKIALVSIPRDTRVDGKIGSFDKINAANYVGGPKLAVKTVEELMGITINNYVEMDFNGFKSIVDTLGGVTINVPQRMYKKYEDIDLYPGVQKLNGRQALGFVRFRGYLQGDIQRTAQQQEFIKALVKETLKPKTIIKLPKLAKEINRYIETDLTMADMLKMASWAPGFNSESIVAQTLPGYFYDKRDTNGNLIASYWITDEEVINGLLDKMLLGQTVAVVRESPYPQAVPRQVQQQNQPDVDKVQDNTDRENIDQENIDQENTDEENIDQERSDLSGTGQLEEYSGSHSQI